jgi:hypothetical protein
MSSSNNTKSGITEFIHNLNLYFCEKWDSLSDKENRTIASETKTGKGCTFALVAQTTAPISVKTIFVPKLLRKITFFYLAY